MKFPKYFFKLFCFIRSWHGMLQNQWKIRKNCVEYIIIFLVGHWMSCSSNIIPNNASSAHSRQGIGRQFSASDRLYDAISSGHMDAIRLRLYLDLQRLRSGRGHQNFRFWCRFIALLLHDSRFAKCTNSYEGFQLHGVSGKCGVTRCNLIRHLIFFHLQSEQTKFSHEMFERFHEIQCWKHSVSSIHVKCDYKFFIFEFRNIHSLVNDLKVYASGYIFLEFVATVMILGLALVVILLVSSFENIYSNNSLFVLR